MVRRCWAAGSGGCSASLSDEHPISQHIFDSEVLELHGAAWLPDTVRSLPLSRISARVLCEAHNGMLSPLDTAIGNLAKALRRLNTANSRGVVDFHGPTLERWCVKALFGFVAAGWHRPSGNRFVMGDAPQHLIDFAFGVGPLPTGCGLHMLTYEGAFQDSAESIAVKPLVANEAGSHIVGLLVGLPPIAFALALRPGDITPTIRHTQLLSHPDWRDKRAFYRPSRITCQGSHGSEIVINVGW